jgi:hypothetical protein
MERFLLSPNQLKKENENASAIMAMPLTAEMPSDGFIFTRERKIINPGGDPSADLDATIIGRVS